MVVIVVVVVFFTPKPHIIEKERTHICSTSPSLSTFCMHFHTVGSVVDASTGDPLGRKNGDSSTFSKNSRSSVYRIASGSALSSSSSVSSFNVAFVMLLLLLLLLLLLDDDDVKRKKRSCWCSLRLVLKGAVVVVVVVVVVMSSFKGFFVVLVKV